jgi:uncharacterized UPF0160 family protein
MNYLKNITMTNEIKKEKLVTHDGSFHADDVFACATLSLVLEKENKGFEIIRTRDEETIKSGDVVFDVGGIYDEITNRFDHHQKGGAGKRKNGIEYSSFGLVWKKFGAFLSSDEEMGIIDKRLVAPIDAGDNGMDIVEKKYDIFPYMIQEFFRVMRPTLIEPDLSMDKMFEESVTFAKKILGREIVHARDFVLSNRAILDIYENTKDKRILVFDKNYHGGEILDQIKETLFVVHPRGDGSFGVKAIRKDVSSFENKKDFPNAWAGLKGEELAKVTGVEDAIFCHRALFTATAKTKEGAIRLAELALND